MANRTTYNIHKHEEFTRQVIYHHYPKRRLTITALSGGLTNYVYAVKAGKEELVVRISDSAEKIHSFQKEQWAVAKAKEKGVPVPDILEVGNNIIPFPYMISKKIKGDVAIHHEKRLDIIREIGRYAALIHTIPTNDYGHVFDWSPNTLSKNKTWKEYLDCELNVNARLEILRKNKILPPSMIGKITRELVKMRRWKQSPCLHHGDLRLKNVMVDQKGKITAILDWENCISSIGSYWDTSIALHDLSIDAQWRYLDGYGLPDKKVADMSDAVKVFNLLNYAPAIQRIIDQKDKEKLGHYKLRLKGVLDLFSL